MPGMWDWLTSPMTDAPSRFAKGVGDMISPANQEGSMLRGFLSGAAEGAGNVVSDMTSPLGIASLASGGVGGFLRGIGPMRNATGAINNIKRAIEPTIDILENTPVRQIMPNAGAVDDLVFQLQNNLSRVPNARGMNVPSGGMHIPSSGAQRARAFGPTMPAEMVPRGGEAAFNAGRQGSIFRPRPAQEVAYDSVRRRQMR